MLSTSAVVGASFAYLLLLFGLAHWGDRRVRQGRSAIANAGVYTLSLGVYCTAWTYFGSVGRAAGGGVWFLPIYLGPTLAFVLAGTVLRKMVRIARIWRIASIADFIGSRYGKSRLLAGLVTLIAVVGVVPYIALQLKAISAGYALLAAVPGVAAPAAAGSWWADSTLYLALALAGFTMVFGTRHLDTAERHEGLVLAIAAESGVKLLAFLAVGIFVTWGLFDGPAEIYTRIRERPELLALLRLGGSGGPGGRFDAAQWFTLMLLAMFSVILLPRQFQILVVENVDERHLQVAAWAFPLYLLLINLFVLPIAFGGLLLTGGGAAQAETFVLSLPLAAGQPALALVAFIGGLSAATGMVIVEAIAVSTMVCNDLVLPLLLRSERFGARSQRDLAPWLPGIRRVAILLLLLLGYVYFRVAGEAYALVGIGLISFAAVAQFAPALFGGMFWKGGTRNGALVGLAAGFALWVWTLMLPSLAKSGWLDGGFLHEGPFGIALLRPERLFGLTGLDNLSHAMFWSLLANTGAYVGISLLRRPTGREAAQALLFVDVFEHPATAATVDGVGSGTVGGAVAAGRPVFWRGRARRADLLALLARFIGKPRARELFDRHARQPGAATGPETDAHADAQADAALVQFTETHLAGAIGSASARLMVASAVEEEPLERDDVQRILDEASQLRAHSRELELRTQALQRAGEELRAANEQLTSLDRLKDDFMSSVTHELRTPLTSIRALAELMADDPAMDAIQRQQFIGLVLAETERLSRLVNQVLDLAKIESGHADWQSADIDLPALCALLTQAAETVAELFHARGARLSLELPESSCLSGSGMPSRRLRADPDRLMQVLLNLLGNAAKFVPAGSGQVWLRLVADEAGVSVQVRDNGPGVPEAQRALVFEKFRQGGDAGQRPPGTGLGLPISRRIVEHFGGRLWLRAEPGPPPAPGACFGFDLPWVAEPGDPP